MLNFYKHIAKTKQKAAVKDLQTKAIQTVEEGTWKRSTNINKPQDEKCLQIRISALPNKLPNP